MAGIDGTQVMQTINVPKSVLIGASERPVLLTVTPKNGIHKGQKQIVVLTRNQGGIGAVAKSAILASTTPGASPASPTKVMLGVIDLADPEVETPQKVADRIRAGLKYVSADKLLPAPDCGMKYLPRATAFGKLKSLADGAAIVRKELG